MSPVDSLTLAVTKLRVRRIRLGITVTVMSLLFAGLIFISILVAGATRSANVFGKEGLGGRFIVQAQPYSFIPYGNDSLESSLLQQQTSLIAQKTAVAKKYSIAYDSKTDHTLPIITSQYGPSSSDVNTVINPSSPLVLSSLASQNAQIPVSYSDFQSQAKYEGAINTYRSTLPDFTVGGSSTNIQVLLNGKEDYTQKDNDYGQPTGVKSITSLGWNQMSDDLLKPFLLDGQTTKIGSDGSLPITTPYSAAREIAGLDKLPDTATDKQKIDQLQAVRKMVAGKEVTMCYRNDASTNLLQKAIDQVSEIAANKGKKDYVPPELQYNLPSQACGPVTIKKDTRTKDEKLATAHQDELDAITTPQVDPVQGLFTVRIIGITADVDTGGSSSLSAGTILASILQSNLGQGWLSPTSAFQPGSIPTQAQGGLLGSHALASQVYYAEFPSLTIAQSFIKQQTCDTSQFNGTQGGDPNTIATHCIGAKRYYNVSSFGNNAGAIADFQHHAWKYARFVLLAVVIIAIFVMIGTLGKIIADSRRETAVFRALGARRLHISQIYITYSLLLGCLIILLSFLIGSVAAGVVNRRLEPGLSTGAVIAYNARNVHQQFSVFSLNWQYIGIIALIILATSLAATAFPLLLNMRRNPIRDMREE